MTTPNTPDHRIDDALNTFKNSTQGKQATELTKSALRAIVDEMMGEVIGDMVIPPEDVWHVWSDDSKAMFKQLRVQRQRIPQILDKYFKGGK